MFLSVIIAVTLFLGECYSRPQVPRVQGSDPIVYTWGYQFPGQYHQESKTYSGDVQGSVGYTNAAGSFIQYQYLSDPNSGFRIVDPSLPTPVVKTGPVNGNGNRIRVPVLTLLPAYHQPLGGQNSNTNRVVVHAGVGDEEDVYVAPSLPEAPSGSVLLRSNSPLQATTRFTLGMPYVDHFFVTPEEIQQAGGVSAAAVKYDAVPVAAVHDAKVPRYH